MIIHCQTSEDVVRAGVIAKADDMVVVDGELLEETSVEREVSLLRARGVAVNRGS